MEKEEDNDCGGGDHVKSVSRVRSYYQTGSVENTNIMLAIIFLSSL